MLRVETKYKIRFIDDIADYLSDRDTPLGVHKQGDARKINNDLRD